MQSKKILVLGATGFIGGHIARLALEKQWRVFGFHRNPTRFGQLKGYPIQWILGDLTDTNTLHAAMQGMDAVFHAAAFYPTSGKLTEVQTQVAYAEREIKNVIQAALSSNISRIIYTSSLTTIGHPKSHEYRLADERDFYEPGLLSKSAYYESKIVMEDIFLDACTLGLPGIVLNPTAVFGPGDYNLSMAKLLVAVSKGWVIASPKGSINVVDVRDVAESHVMAFEKGKIGERYIIGGHNFTIQDAIREVATVAGVLPPWFEIPSWILNAVTLIGDLIPIFSIYSNHLRAIHLWQGYNTNKAQQALNLSPRPFRETVQDTLTWLRNHGYG